MAEKLRQTVWLGDDYSDLMHPERPELPQKYFAAEWRASTPLTSPPTHTWLPGIVGHDHLLYSQGNRNFNKLKDGNVKGRIGGEFKVAHHRIERCVPTLRTYAIASSGGDRRFRGRFRAFGGSSSDYANRWPKALWSSDDELDAFGTTAIAITEPTNPLSGLTNALIELKREGLPTVPGIETWRQKTVSARSAGSEYLNKEFGWDPIISDIRKAVHVTRNAEKLIEQYANGSGRKIKREFRAPEEVTTSEVTGQSYEYLWPSGVSQVLFVTAPKWKVTTKVIKRRWFKGCFTYYLPPYKVGSSNFERNRRLANKLYGVGVTPELVWNLTPWSWAADWVSNAGDVFHNIGAFRDNGLVMQYGYVMEEIIHRKTIDMWEIRTKSSETTPAANIPKNMSCSTTLETITRQRRVATPYGFGLSWDGFNPFQISILAALGLSRRD